MNNELINSFIEELKSMGFNPIFDIDNEIISLEYPAEKHTKEVRKLFDKYIGFWKGIAIRTNHDRTNKIARYEIPFHLIKGKDLTDEQLNEVIEHIHKNL